MSRLLFLLLLCVCSLATASAQSRPANDGFQRHDGTMYLIRNGQRRPMTHDVHLPNGRTVTRDGFVVQADGRRTELAEGIGCTLLGEPTAVLAGAGGQLALAPSLSSRPAAVQVVEVSDGGVLEELFGRRGRGHKWGHYKKKHGKHRR